ncbi:hypothetical protein [Bosea sp. TAF32]|uniref:hypothetical protein n=1 Tax=Bosea sp. TAF32 TaxID=3237482 RepID=UPI003F920DB9
MKRIVLALGALGALALAGCQTTAIDSRIAEASDRLSARCADLQTAALAVDLFAPEKVRAAAQQGQVVLSQFCAKPPRTAADLAIAIGETIKAVQAIEAAKRG